MWPFKRNKPTAPLEVNKNGYLSVLLGAQPRPPVLAWLNPDGSNGAVKGFAAPLSQGASQDLLSQPIENGSYALATPDRKTLVQADVFAMEDVTGFQLPSEPAAQQAVDLSAEKLQRGREATAIATFVFKGHSPDVYESVRFFLDCAARLAEETDGIVADPMAETYRLPKEFRQSAPLDPRIDFRDIGSIKAIQRAEGVWISTRGMAKFNLAEYEVLGVRPEDVNRIGELLIVTSQEALLGSPVPLDQTVSTPFGNLQAVEGRSNREFWGNRSTIELRLV